MENGTTTPEGQAGAQTVAGGASAPAGTGPSVGELSLKELNTLLNKNYLDRDSALSSIKETFSFVGKKAEAFRAAAPAVIDPAIAEQLREMKTELFYSKNSQYDTPEYREVISKMGENPAEVVQGAAFKNIFEKTTGYDKIQKTKTVLESNPRIGQLRSKIQEAKTASASNDSEKAVDLAVSAVLDVYEMK